MVISLKMAMHSHHIDQIWEKQIALFGAGINDRARLLRELCPDITPRESHVAALAEKGLSNGEIAEHLSIAITTVDNHSSHARHKANVPSNLKFRKLIKFVEEREKQRIEATFLRDT
jgi:DNA-binding NarL/FixJ family response regulator